MVAQAETAKPYATYAAGGYTRAAAALPIIPPTTATPVTPPVTGPQDTWFTSRINESRIMMRFIVFEFDRKRYVNNFKRYHCL
jgi:hypothetical protein